MTSLKLRPYQDECLQSIHEHYKQGINRQLVHLPTAAGKTVIFASLTKQLKCRTLILAHTIELLEQAKDKMQMIAPGLEVGLVNSSHKEFNKHVVISTIQSARQPETLIELQKQNFGLLIYDECHRAAASSPREVLQALGFFNSTDKLLCGYSATPFRTDSKGLGEVFQKVVYKKTIKDLIALGFLCKPVGIKIKTDLDLTTVKTEDGDFVTQSLASVMDTPQMNELVVNTYIEQAKDRKTVCFAVTIQHAKNLSTAFRNHGITSEVIHGDTPPDERSSLLERFKNGSISVLTNCQILTEGWDCPEVNCVLVAKPTQSKGLYQQMCGRGLRQFPNKQDCLILDFGSKSHSLCSTAELLNDEDEKEENAQRPEGKLSEFAKTLPPTINKKLKSAIIEFDLLGDSFTWEKDGNIYSLKAVGDSSLKIVPMKEGRFNVLFFQRNSFKTISQDLSFEYAFASAEGFVKENRSLFVVSDLEAPWRKLPISEKQADLFRSFGYRSGISDLSRGQAALIISSGVLRKKAVRGKSGRL